MITGIWLYWVWVLAALALDYVILNCVYAYDEKGEKTFHEGVPKWIAYVSGGKEVTLSGEKRIFGESE